MALPGAVAALRALAREHRLGLVTQKPEAPSRALLAELGFGGLFDALTFGDTYSFLKPDPRMIHETAAPLGTGPLIFVGDSEVDAETARAAGVPFVLRRGGYRHGDADPPADAAFDDFAALPALIARLLAS